MKGNIGTPIEVNIGRDDEFAINGWDAPIQNTDKDLKRGAAERESVFDGEKDGQEGNVGNQSGHKWDGRYGKANNCEVLPMPSVCCASSSLVRSWEYNWVKRDKQSLIIEGKTERYQYEPAKLHNPKMWRAAENPLLGDCRRWCGWRPRTFCDLFAIIGVGKESNRQGRGR